MFAYYNATNIFWLLLSASGNQWTQQTKDPDNFHYEVGTQHTPVWLSSGSGQEQLINLLDHICGMHLRLSLWKLTYVGQTVLSYIAVYCLQNGKTEQWCSVK